MVGICGEKGEEQKSVVFDSDISPFESPPCSGVTFSLLETDVLLHFININKTINIIIRTAAVTQIPIMKPFEAEDDLSDLISPYFTIRSNIVESFIDAIFFNILPTNPNTILNFGCLMLVAS